jgi:pimeloyl-ACP methyl ester carboxylesterase
MSLVLSTEGSEVAYRSVGSGPPDLVFLHGWAGSGAYFQETVDALDLERVRATTLDFSGHGHSPASDREWSLEAIDDAVLTVADAVGLRRSVLVGYSMSGKFAQHFATRHPERVAGLILVAGAPAAPLPLPPELLEDWYARAGSAKAMKELIRGFLGGPVDEPAFDRFARDAAQVPRSALEGTARAAVETDFAGSVAAIDVPTLVIGGARDELMPPELLRDGVVAQIAGARLALVDCGHEIPLERPAELAALIEAFLAGLHERR